MWLQLSRPATRVWVLRGRQHQSFQRRPLRAPTASGLWWLVVEGFLGPWFFENLASRTPSLRRMHRGRSSWMHCSRWQWTTSWIWRRWAFPRLSFETLFDGRSLRIPLCLGLRGYLLVDWASWCLLTGGGFSFALNMMPITATHRHCSWPHSWRRSPWAARQLQLRCTLLWLGLCLAWVLTYQSPIGSLNLSSSMLPPTLGDKPQNWSRGS